MSVAPKRAEGERGELAVRRSRPWTLTGVSLGLRAGEGAIILLAALVAALLRFDDRLPDGEYVLLAVFGAVNHLFLSHIVGTYHLRTLVRSHAGMGKALACWGVAWAAVILLCFATKTSADFSRLWFGAWLLLSGVGILSARAATVVIVSYAGRTGLLAEQVVLLGSRPALSATRALLERAGSRVVGYIDLSDRADGLACLDQARQDVERICASCGVDRVMLAPDLRDEAQLTTFTDQFMFLPVETVLLPPNAILERALDSGAPGAAVPILGVVARRPLNDADRVLKRVFDIVVGAALLVGFSPLLLLVALAVRLDSRGPVLYRQQRTGFGGATFSVYKFRTMSVDACQAPDVRQATRHDPRVTRVGRILRRTSLDEFPQLLNVLRGEMSLVGPRPHALAHDAAFAQEVRDYLTRHRVKPGMTGLAQVCGLRGEITHPDLLRRRVAKDLYYVENWSLVMDCKILVLTIFALMGRNAY